jgi:hypothetical protein
VVGAALESIEVSIALEAQHGLEAVAGALLIAAQAKRAAETS